MLVLPREGLGGPRSHANALISMVSHPGEKGNNSVEISTFPSGKFSTINVSDTQSSQYKIVHTDLMLDSSGRSAGCPWLPIVEGYLDIYPRGFHGNLS